VHGGGFADEKTDQSHSKMKRAAASGGGIPESPYVQKI